MKYVDNLAKGGTVYWDEVIETLIKKDILVIKDSDLDKKENALERWKWNRAAQILSFCYS